MLIKKIIIEKNPIFWNLFELDFCDKEWNISKNVILAWENWTWKTYILKVINSFPYFPDDIEIPEQKITFNTYLSEEEKNILLSSEIIKNNYQIKPKLDSWLTVMNEVTMINSHNNIESWIYITFNDNTVTKIDYNILYTLWLLKSLFSSTTINYANTNVGVITSLDMNQINKKITIDEKIWQTIAQLLVNIKHHDANDLSNWVNMNKWLPPTDDKIDIRKNKLNSWFKYIFENLQFDRIDSRWSSFIPVFKKNSTSININNLSSWEKQIVFRGWYILANMSSLNWFIVLVDEPEISLHPEWQLKITEFYKRILQNPNTNEQTSQLFIVTHSPFIIHSWTRTNDKIITLSRDKTSWSVVVDNPPKYFWYTWIKELISDSFNLENFKSITKPILLVEDEYVQIYKIAWLKLKWIDFTENDLDNIFDNNCNYVICSWKWASWVSWALRAKDPNIFSNNIIVWLFDYDKEWSENFYHLWNDDFWDKESTEESDFSKWIYKTRKDKNNIYALLLPIPERLNHLITKKQNRFENYIEVENLLPEKLLNDSMITKEKVLEIEYIKLKNTSKKTFWKTLLQCSKDDFKDFQPLFDRVEEFISK